MNRQRLARILRDPYEGAFPVEAYGVAADKSDLVDRAFTWFATP